MKKVRGYVTKNVDDEHHHNWVGLGETMLCQQCGCTVDKKSLEWITTNEVCYDLKLRPYYRQIPKDNAVFYEGKWMEKVYANNHWMVRDSKGIWKILP